MTIYRNNKYQQKLFPQIEQILNIIKTAQTRIDKRRQTPLNQGDIVFRKENRRNKITQRFTKHKVV